MNRSHLRRRWLRDIAAVGGILLLAAPLSVFADDPPGKAPDKPKAPDLSTPAKAAESFFKAAKAGDAAALKQIISPRIQEVIAKGGGTLEDFAKVWAGELEFISAAEPPADEIAKGRVRVPVTGKSNKSDKQETHRVRFTKSGNVWLMDER